MRKRVAIQILRIFTAILLIDAYEASYPASLGLDYLVCPATMLFVGFYSKPVGARTGILLLTFFTLLTFVTSIDL